MGTLYVTGLSKTQKAIFEENKDQLEEIFNEEGLTMKGVIDKDGKLLISAEPMDQDVISDRIAKKVREDLGLGVTVRL